jgi:hypothetical protein
MRPNTGLSTLTAASLLIPLISAGYVEFNLRKRSSDGSSLKARDIQPADVPLAIDENLSVSSLGTVPKIGSDVTGIPGVSRDWSATTEVQPHA